MPFCVSFFESTVDTLLSLIAAAMTLVASLVHPLMNNPYTTSPTSALSLASFEEAQDAGARDTEVGARVSGIAAKLRSADPGARVTAACELQRLGADARGAITALVERLSDDTPVDPKVCGDDRHYWSRSYDQQVTPGEEAAAALVAIGTESLQPLITAARAPQWVARKNAVWALGSLRDSRSVVAVLTAMQDSEPPVRATAAWALGAINGRR